jgi:copper(I)-binding protein
MAEVGDMKASIRLLALVGIAIFFGCREQTVPASPELSIEGGWVRAADFVTDDHEHPLNSAAYLVIQNSGRAADLLTGAETEAANVVEIHETTIMEDVMRMRKLEGLEVPAEGSAELEPGGVHLMLLGLTRPLLEGEEVGLTLHFQASGEIALTVPVRLMGGG